MPYYDYTCPEGHIFEKLRPIAERDNAECPECGQIATKNICAPTIKLDHISGDHIGATLRWEKQRKQKMAQELKQGNHEI